jgi:hypothetical protein
VKFLFLLCDTVEGEAAKVAAREGGVAEAFYRDIRGWFQANAAVLGRGRELQPAAATTVRRGVVTDGPFIEGNEVIGGLVEVEVADLAAAIALARTWPGHAVEVREVCAR